MSLHAQNIAIAAGAPPLYISECVSYMIESNRINQIGAKEFLEAHHLRGSLATLSLNSVNDPIPPSMFYFEDSENSIKLFGSQEESVVSLNIAFKTFTEKPLNLFFTSEQNGNSIIQSLLGDKSYEWVTTVVHLLEKVKFSSLKPGRAAYSLSKKLKFLSLLLNILVRRLYIAHPEATKTLVKAILAGETFAHSDSVVEGVFNDNPTAIKSQRTLSGAFLTANLPETSEQIELRKSSLFNPNLMKIMDDIVTESQDSTVLQVGLPLLLSIWQVFECRSLQWVGDRILLKELLQEQRQVVASIIACADGVKFDHIVEITSKRLNVSCFLFCDAVRYEDDFHQSTNYRFMHTLGKLLENEQMAVRDTSNNRLKRDVSALEEGSELCTNGDYSGGVTNSFLIYLVLEKKFTRTQVIKINTNARKDELISGYHEFISQKFQESRKMLKEMHIFDFDEASSLFRSYYAS